MRHATQVLREHHSSLYFCWPQTLKKLTGPEAKQKKYLCFLFHDYKNGVGRVFFLVFFCG